LDLTSLPPSSSTSFGTNTLGILSRSVVILNFRPSTSGVSRTSSHSPGCTRSTSLPGRASTKPPQLTLPAKHALRGHITLLSQHRPCTLSFYYNQ
jgi:hypothetical protein